MSMKIDLNKANYDGDWYEFGGIRLKIRPFPMSRADVSFKDGAVVISGDSSHDMFAYCLVDHEGLVDADGKPIKLTPEVKKKIYDFKLGRSIDENGDEASLSDFVIRKARLRQEQIGNDEKN